MRFDPNRCLSQQQVEDYVFDRLAGAQLEAVEEHLLACADCTDRLQEEELYVAAFRSAAVHLESTDLKVVASVGAKTEPARKRDFRTWIRPFAAAACLVLSVGIWTAVRGPDSVAQPVTLMAQRGGTLMPVASARSNAGLDLHLDLTGLELKDSVQITLVDGVGKAVDSAVLESSTSGSVTWSLGRKLSAGTYWIRAHGEGGKMLREFQLNIER